MKEELLNKIVKDTMIVLEYEENKKKAKDRCKKYYSKNKEKILEQQKEYQRKTRRKLSEIDTHERID